MPVSKCNWKPFHLLSHALETRYSDFCGGFVCPFDSNDSIHIEQMEFQCRRGLPAGGKDSRLIWRWRRLVPSQGTIVAQISKWVPDGNGRVVPKLISKYFFADG